MITMIKTSNSKRITPPQCRACGMELTIIDRPSEGILDDSNLVSRMANILSSKEHNNIMLTGEAGTGKSASVKLLGRRVAEGKIEELTDKRIFEINIDLLFNECYTPSAKGEKLRLLFQEAEENNLILFIDEGHRIYGSGESNSVGNIVKPYITEGTIRLILATTNDEYEEFIAKDAALSRRFERIRLKEPDAKRTAAIIRSVFDARYPELSISDETIKELVKLSSRYVRDKRFNPDKSISILDYTAAWLKNNDARKEITEETLKNALAEKFCIRKERFAQDLTSSIRGLNGKLSDAVPAWRDALTELSSALSEALTRNVRDEGPLCMAAMSGSDISLLRDVAGYAAAAMGFDKSEIIRVSAADTAEKLTEPFMVNPNRAIIAELRKDGVYDASEIIGLLTLILRDGHAKGKYGNADYSMAPVFLLFEGEEEKCATMGFGAGTKSSVRLNATQEDLAKFWGVGRLICFGSIGSDEAEALYEKRFLPMLTKHTKDASTPKITLAESAKGTITERLASPDGWSAAKKITSELILKAALDGGKRYSAETDGKEITLVPLD